MLYLIEWYFGSEIQFDSKYSAIFLFEYEGPLTTSLLQIKHLDFKMSQISTVFMLIKPQKESNGYQYEVG